MFRSKNAKPVLEAAVVETKRQRRVFTLRNAKNWILVPAGAAVVAHVVIDHVAPNYLETKKQDS
jgi:hypothetical protein